MRVKKCAYTLSEVRDGACWQRPCSWRAGASGRIPPAAKLTAAMFQVAVLSLVASSGTFQRGPTHMLNRSLDEAIPMFVA